MDFDTFLRRACPPLDLQWRKYRRRAARHRVRGRIERLGLSGYQSYLGYIRDHPGEGASLADLMRITVSRFFRERDCWLKLVREVIPPILGTRPPGQPFRAWSIGCCGGEEPYGLVILWRESVAPFFPQVELLTTATDIDGSSLERAAAGRYPASSLREVPESVRNGFFKRESDFWEIDDSVIRAVTFEERNLTDGPLPEKQDLLLCRYFVFTYYLGRRRLEAARLLRASLREGGFLFTGRKEGLGPDELELFEPLTPSCGIYRRRGPA